MSALPTWTNLVVIAVSSILGGGGMAKVILAIASSKVKKAEAVNLSIETADKLNDSTLEYARTLKEDATSARIEAASARAEAIGARTQAEAAHREAWLARTELTEIRSEALALAKLVRDIVETAWAQDATIDEVRGVLLRARYGPDQLRDQNGSGKSGQ